MKYNWRDLLYKLGIILGGGLFAYQVFLALGGLYTKNLPYQQWFGLLLGVVFVALALGVQIFVWKNLMGLFGVTMTYTSAIQGYALPFLARYIPGSVWGYIGRNEWLLKNYNTIYTVSNLASVFEILIGITTCLAIVVSGYVFFLTKDWLVAIVSLVVVGVALIALLKLSFGYAVNFFLPAQARKTRWGSWFSFMAWYLLLWLSYGLLCYVVALFFMSNSSITVLEHASVFALAWLIGFVVLFVPAGLGVRELTMSALLAYFFYVNASDANMLSVTTRLAITFAEVVWVMCALAITRKS